MVFERSFGMSCCLRALFGVWRFFYALTPELEYFRSRGNGCRESRPSGMPGEDSLATQKRLAAANNNHP